MNTLLENFKNLPENFSEIFKHPTSIITLIGLLIIILAYIKIRSVKLNPRLMSHIGLVLALSTVLSAIPLFKMPYGGSVTLASMVPIILLSLIYGAEVGLLTGLLYGVLQLILGPYILHPVQVLFDYPLPFMALGLAGYFKEKKLVGITVAIIGRLVFHYLSGIVFFASYAAEYNLSPYIYSLYYNGAYLLPELVITLVVISLVPLETVKSILLKQRFYRNV